MRLTTVILIASLMQVSASSLAQKITLSKSGASLKSVLKELRLQSGYDFIVTDDVLAESKKVSVTLQQIDFENALKEIFKDQPLNYTIKNTTVVVSKKEASLLDRAKTVISNLVRDLSVKGRVTDQDGKPLPNASIRVKGKSAVTNTNQDGEFEIKGVDEDAVLLVSYVGFKTLEIALKDAVMPLEIKLNVATGELEEVKVTYSTGYQNIPKERATGSFVQLSNEDINRTVSTNILDRITSLTSSIRKVHGGEGLGGTDISIRGISTIRANKKPLIVIDGFPYDEIENILDVRQNILNNLNPNDVESITILRDAAAASIWGARAGNGVIVINTKRGKFNRSTQIQFSGNVNITNKPNLNKLDIMSSADVIEFEKLRFSKGAYNVNDDTYAPSGIYPYITPAIEILLAQRRGEITNDQTQKYLTDLAQIDIRNDINRYLIRESIKQQNSLSLTGGSENMNYYISLGYDKNINQKIGEDYSRKTLRISNTYRPFKNITFNTFLVFTQSDAKNNGIDFQRYLSTGVNKAAPYIRFADENGNSLHAPIASGAFRQRYLDNPGFEGMLDWHYRPLDELKFADNKSNQFDGRLGADLDYTILKNLKISLKGQYEKGINDINNYYSLNTYTTRNLINQFVYKDASGKLQYPIPYGGYLENEIRKTTSWNLRGQVNYNKSWGIHTLDAIIGFETSEAVYSNMNNRRYGYDPETLTSTNVNSNLSYALRTPGGVSSGLISSGQLLNGLLNRFLSQYFNVGYTFKEKYIFTGSVRTDASNFLGIKANQRIVPLWSTGLSWDLSKEDFYRFTGIPYLKLRLTYGYQGNLDNSATSLPIVSYIPSWEYNNSPALFLSSPPNPGITWEKSRIVNFAIDFKVKNWMNASLEYYVKKGMNLVGQQPIESTRGASSYVTNYGEMKSKGLDFMIDHKTNITPSISIKSAFNLSYNINKITDYFFGTYYPSSLVSSGLMVGKPYPALFSYKWAGLDSKGNPLGYMGGQVHPYSDIIKSSDSELKTEDLEFNGSTSPRYFGSFLNAVTFKNLTISFSITYSLGYYFRRPSIDYNQIINNFGGHKDYNSRWKNPGDELFTNVPSLSTDIDDRYNFYGFSNILIEKGDHIRLNDVRLDYNINKSFIKKLTISNASIFLYANNLGVIWTANKYGIDPNFFSQGTIRPSKSFAIGLNLNF